jgi:hypothetical protein
LDDAWIWIHEAGEWLSFGRMMITLITMPSQFGFQIMIHGTFGQKEVNLKAFALVHS